MTNQNIETSEKNQESLVVSAKPTFRLTPAIDIYETEAELVLLAELPGVDEAGLQLEVSRGVLTLEGAVQVADNEKQRSYYRQFTLSERINADAGDAVFKDGVLTLHLPKSEEAKPKKIAIKTLH